MKYISSRENPEYRIWRQLARSGRERRKRGQLLLEGMHLLLAWQQVYGLPARVLLGEQARWHQEISSWLEANPLVKVVIMPDAMLAELADTETPVGIMALVDQPVLARGPDLEMDTVLLDGVQDPGNLGTLLRTAAAAGFGQILLSRDCASLWSPKVLRAAQGAHFLLAIHEQYDLPAFIAGFSGTSLATRLGAGTSLYDAVWSEGPVAWVFGSEGQGVSPPVLAQTALHVGIPMPGKTESLNVGAAAAICLFETVRRRLVNATSIQLSVDSA